MFFLSFSLIILQSQASAEAIGALGTLKPLNGVVTVRSLAPAAISEMFLKRGDLVDKGATVATLSDQALTEAEVVLAKLNLKKLNDAHSQNIALLKLKIELAQTQLNRASQTLEKYLALPKNAQVSAMTDQKQNAVEDARHSLKSARGEMDSATANFTADKEVLEAQIAIAKIKASSSTVVAPFSGLVLEIIGAPGSTAQNGILKMADVSEMIVECEVYEGDIQSIKVGQRAEVSSKALKNTLTGSVSFVGRLVSTDRKVASILVALEQSEEASKFIGMEVNVKILQ
jgi:HlyD family secretion protein